MNPSRQPHPLAVERVEWIPSSPDEIEVRVYGAWQGGSVPPAVTLVVGNDIFQPLADPPAAGPPPAWTAAYRVPIDARAAVEEGNAAIAGPDFALPLPAAGPGALDPPPGTVVDPAVLAERRARRESATARDTSAEQAVETLRAQIANLEERAARAAETRDALAARVADSEQRLRSAERRAEEEWRRREQLEREAEARGGSADAEAELEALRTQLAAAAQEAVGAHHAAQAEVEALRAELATGDETVAALERDLDEARRRAEEAEGVLEAERAARRAAEEAAARATSAADALRGEAETLRAEGGADAAALRAEADSLRAEAESLRAEAESLRARAREAEQLRAEAEILRSRAARDRPQPEHERALIGHIAALEAELSRRSSVQERVQEAIGLIRAELAQVRAQVRDAPGRAAAEAELADLRARVAELEERGRGLEAALRARAAELDAARSELDRARRDAAAARAEADRHRRALDAVERAAAEARATTEPGAPGDPASPAPPPTGDPALDTLIAGLREQVTAARAQLAQWGVEEQPAPEPGAADPAEEETRRRLQSIAAELRAAVPDELTAPGAGDVIGDLQRAAERLRAAAEEELERLGEPPAAGPAPQTPAAAAETPPGAAAETPAATIPPGAPVAELGARRIAHVATESDWLRRGLERLAHREPETAAKLFAALLPAQGLVAEDLAYDITAPTAGTLRVVLTGGTARVEPIDRAGVLGHVDAVLDGPLDALAPLAAGGGGRRLKGVSVSGSRRRIRKLLKARRDPVGLLDLGRAGSPVHPGLLLSALAAAVDPVWTRGHRFAVAYAIGGDGTFTVVAADGEPLRVLSGTPAHAGELAASVVVSAPAFMPLLAGEPPPPGERASVAGDRRVVDVLHTWFDAARGVATR